MRAAATAAAAAGSAAPAATAAASAHDPAPAAAAAPPAHATRRELELQPAGYLPFEPAVTSVSGDWCGPRAARRCRRVAGAVRDCGDAPGGAAAAAAAAATLRAGPASHLVGVRVMVTVRVRVIGLGSAPMGWG